MKIYSPEGYKKSKLKKITLTNGEEIEFEPLVYNENNLIKVNLSWNGKDTEGIWAVISDEDKKDYQNNKRDGMFVCMLANNAISFYPNNSWGLHVIAKHKGNERPEARISWFDITNKENRIWSENVSEDKRN